jgi:hypothetical protein
MKRMLGVLGIVVMLILAVSSRDVWTQVAKDMAAKSPWGPDDEIGTLNMMTDDSRFDILKRIGTGKVYDLSVDLYVGMPGCCASFGDPSYQIWMTHTPKRATAKTSPPESGELASYSGDAISMYTLPALILTPSTTLACTVRSGIRSVLMKHLALVDG